MKKLCCIFLITLFCTFPVASIPAQEKFLIYGIYYGNATSKGIRNIDWDQFDLMILHPGSPGDDYKNLNDSAFLLRIQEMRDAGVEVFFYEDIGCERDAGGEHYSKSDRKEWLDFKKKEIDLFVRFADGIFLDCIGPTYGGQFYGDQFGRDVQELVDYVHYSHREVIIGDLWSIMEWVKAGKLDLVPSEADYVLFEGAWSLTPDQYADYWDTLSATTFAKSYEIKILGLDFGSKDDSNRITYCYCASRVFGFSGTYYSWEDFFEGVNILDVPYDLGLPYGNYTYEGDVYTRRFQKGDVYVDLQTHRGWIEGEAGEEAGVSWFLILAAFFLVLSLKRRHQA